MSSAELSRLLWIFKLIFHHQQNKPKKAIAAKHLHQIVTGGGMVIYLPKGPDVLMKIMAKLSSMIRDRCAGVFKGTMLKCENRKDRETEQAPLRKL